MLLHAQSAPFCLVLSVLLFLSLFSSPRTRETLFALPLVCLSPSSPGRERPCCFTPSLPLSVYPFCLTPVSKGRERPCCSMLTLPLYVLPFLSLPNIHQGRERPCSLCPFPCLSPSSPGRERPVHCPGSDLPQLGPVVVFGFPAPLAALGSAGLPYQVVQTHAHGSSQEEEGPAPSQPVADAVAVAADVAVDLDGDGEDQ